MSTAPSAPTVLSRPVVCRRCHASEASEAVVAPPRQSSHPPSGPHDQLDPGQNHSKRQRVTDMEPAARCQAPVARWVHRLGRVTISTAKGGPDPFDPFDPFELVVPVVPVVLAVLTHSSLRVPFPCYPGLSRRWLRARGDLT